MSRLETGTFALHITEAPLKDTIAAAMSTVWARAEEKGIALLADCDSGITVQHDPKWTAEALGNILDNAVKYTPGGGSVAITVRPWQFYTRIDITDTGTGIPEEHYNDIFQRFYRGQEAAALDGIDLAIEKGKFTAIIGASGSGKTTLLNMLGGLDTPDEGEVIVDGVSLAGLKEKELAVFRRGKVGFVYQNFNLIPTLTVKENMLFPLSLAGSTPDPVFFQEILTLLHLEDRQNAYSNQLSGGGQQRVAIARALIAKPSVILADEPTGNLDSKSSQNVLGLLKLSVETWKQTLVMITHNLEIAQMADRVIRIEDGRIRA
ncbi:MAG: ATP-binding cassette domain-containing protein [Candidatus Merdisoma sp.]